MDESLLKKWMDANKLEINLHKPQAIVINHTQNTIRKQQFKIKVWYGPH